MHSPPINLISFFSGYGGLEMGIRAAVGRRLRTIAYVERESFAAANLVQKMEQGRLDSAPVFTDVTTFPYARFLGLVDIACGGVPCQPHSLAGQQRGGSDERFLFDEFIDGLGAMQPKVVFMENVPGLLTSKMPDGSLCIRHIFNRLEKVGFCVEDDQGEPLLGIFSAAEVRASHQRKRVFIMAYRPGCGGWLQTIARSCCGEWSAIGWNQGTSSSREQSGNVADNSISRSGGLPIQPRGSQQTDKDSQRSDEFVANRPSYGRGERRTEPAGFERVDTVASDGGGVADADRGNEEPSGGLRSPAGAEAGTGPHCEPPALSKSAVRLLASGRSPGLGGDESSYRIDQLRALGNGVVAECAAKAFVTLLGKLINQKP